MKVYFRDYAADEMFGEEGNWCRSNYDCPLENGEINLEKFIDAMIKEDLLWEWEKHSDYKLIEKEDCYEVYNKVDKNFTTCEFKIMKYDNKLP